MDTILVCGWVRCGNRWIARLLAYYGDRGQEIEFDRLFARDYWKGRLTVLYFGREVTIRISHIPAYGYWENGAWNRLLGKMEDTHIVHVRRDPRDAFVSWYYMLRESGLTLLPGPRTWKAYLRWLPAQVHQPFRLHAESWLGLEKANPPNVSWTSHERMREDRVWELLHLVAAMGIPLDYERARYAASVLEGEPDRPAYVGTGKETDHTEPRGIPGMWRTHFDAEDARLIENHFGDLIERLGYGGDPHWQALLEERAERLEDV